LKRLTMAIPIRDEDKHGKRSRQIQRTGGILLVAMFGLGALIVGYRQFTRANKSTNLYRDHSFLTRKDSFLEDAPAKLKGVLRRRRQEDVLDEKLEKVFHKPPFKGEKLQRMRDDKDHLIARHKKESIAAMGDLTAGKFAEKFRHLHEGRKDYLAERRVEEYRNHAS